MAKARKRHEQQSLRFPDKNGQFRGRRVGDKRKRGGKRLGRPPKPGRRASEPHKKRPVLKAWQPVHIVQRVNPEVGSLRKRHMYRALREATIAVALRELNTMADGEFRIAHISIQRMHIHLLVEAEHQEALSRGMQSFGISLAKHVNCAYSKAAGLSRRRRGNVIADRFHQEIITSPRQARHALAYVLNNWRKHREDQLRVARGWNVDPYSTSILFSGWKEREAATFLWKPRATYDPLVVYLPKTWLLRVGWRRYGLIRFHEVPSAPPQHSKSRTAAAR